MSKEAQILLYPSLGLLYMEERLTFICIVFLSTLVLFGMPSVALPKRSKFGGYENAGTTCCLDCPSFAPLQPEPVL